jgi:hypothetical protein
MTSDVNILNRHILTIKFAVGGYGINTWTLQETASVKIVYCELAETD